MSEAHCAATSKVAATPSAHAEGDPRARRAIVDVAEPAPALLADGRDEPGQDRILVEDDPKRIADNASCSSIDNVGSRPEARRKRQFHLACGQQRDVSRPDRAVARVRARGDAIAPTFEVDLSQPFPAKPVFIRAIRDQQQVDIRGSMRIAPRPRSYERHGARVFAFQAPIGDRVNYGSNICGFHRVPDRHGSDLDDTLPTSVGCQDVPVQVARPTVPGQRSNFLARFEPF